MLASVYSSVRNATFPKSKEETDFLMTEFEVKGLLIASDQHKIELKPEALFSSQLIIYVMKSKLPCYLLYWLFVSCIR